MKTRTCVGGVFLAILSLLLGGCGAGAVAQFGVFGSYLDSDDLGNGYGGGAKVEVKPTTTLSVDGRASWVYFDDFNIHMIPLEAALRVNFPLIGERIVPYAGVGGGYYIFDARDVDLDNDFGYFPFVGLEVGLRGFALFVEGRWLFLRTDIDTVLDELQDLDRATVDGFGLNAGFVWRF